MIGPFEAVKVVKLIMANVYDELSQLIQTIEISQY